MDRPFVTMDADLLGRFLAGETSPAETTGVHAFFAAHPEIRASLREFIAGLQSPESRALDIDASWRRLEERLAAHDGSVRVVRPRAVMRSTGSHSVAKYQRTPARSHAQPARSGSGRWLSVARFAVVRIAAVALVVGAVHVYTKLTTPKHIPVPAHTYSTRIGERAIVDLSDGSRVTLAPHSSLTIAEGFGEAVRRVDLVGEGYFVIAHNVQTPFVVHSGTVTTRVLGTEFDLKHYPGDRDVRVAVVSGRVASAGAHHPGLTLGARTVGHLTDSTAMSSVLDDTVAYTGWMQGSLKFRDTPVPEVLRTLEEWYTVKFKVEDRSLANATLSGQLDYSSNANMLATLRTLLNVSMTLQKAGETTLVTLRPSRGAARRGAQDFHLPREVGFR